MEKHRHSGGRFLQPLALAGVCFVFVTLLLTLAVMDFRTLDKTLASYMEKQGVDFIRTVQQTSVFNLQRMNGSEEWDFRENASTGLDDQALSMQESMVMALLKLAMEIDYERGEGRLSDKKLVSFASGLGLRNFALFDHRGGVTFQKRSLSKTVQKAISTMVSDHENLKVRIFEPSNDYGSSRFLILRRKKNMGFVALVLDPESFLFWKLRTAVESAVDAVGTPSNMDCFLIRDAAGRTLFQAGTCSESSNGKTSVSGTFDGGVIWDGRKKMLLMERFPLNGGEVGSVRLTLNTETLDRMMGKEKRWAMIAVVFMVFMVVLSMWFLFRNQNRHLARIRQMEVRLHRAERLSAMGRLASGVAHEIRNPLNAVSMACQRLRPDNLQALSVVIRSEINRLNQIIEEFLGLSRGGLKLERGDLADLVRQVGLLMEEEARARGVEIRTEGTESSLMAFMDANGIKQVLINIVKNAMESITEFGTITIGLALKGKETAVVSVTDTGTGLAENDGEKIFNPDFTTKEQGLGLGLSLAHEIIQAHGGEIGVRSISGKGTTFDILLPVKGVTRSEPKGRAFGKRF